MSIKNLKIKGSVIKRTIAIIGAGQAGLQLACGLLQNGYRVHLFSNRTAKQIYHGSILSSQTIFHVALETERKLGLNFWDDKCPKNVSISLAVGEPNSKNKMIEWTGLMQYPYQSIDQRIKFSVWMNYFEQLGGELTIQDVDLSELNKIVKTHELTIVASGKGEIGNIFSKDENRSDFNKPQRVITCLYVNHVKPVPTLPGSRVCIVPNVGEYFSTPGLTHHGACEIIQFEGIPNGPFDCWQDVNTPAAYLDQALSLLKKYVPWEAERCTEMQLTDDKATLTGSFAPIVRHPVASLSRDMHVLGIGDTVVLNDPIAAQGANSAAKAADVYLRSILSHGNNPFDINWMQQTFEKCWLAFSQWSTRWSTMLLNPPAPHIMKLLKTAEQSSQLASKLADGFDKPETLFPWIDDPIETDQIINSVFSEKIKVETTQ